MFYFLHCLNQHVIMTHFEFANVSKIVTNLTFSVIRQNADKVSVFMKLYDF